jgi:hypothetical protein
MQKKPLIYFLIFCVLSVPCVAAENISCDPEFLYRTKSTKRINNLIQGINLLKADADNNNLAEHSNIEAVVGMLVTIFIELPEEKQQILEKESNSYAKGIYVEALYRAGLLEEARTYADKNKIPEVFKWYQDQNLQSLENTKPRYLGYENDLLIGAYTATGDIKYIERILANYKNADDAMVRDSLRLGFMYHQFGPTFAAPDRNTIMTMAVRQKYYSKAKPEKMMQILTLSSAFWAIKSLAKSDEGIKKISAEFFQKDPRLQKFLLEETIALSNYLTALIAYQISKDESSLLIYENLGSASKAFNAMGLK